jgi:hypothetical protein
MLLTLACWAGAQEELPAPKRSAQPLLSPQAPPVAEEGHGPAMPSPLDQEFYDEPAPAGSVYVAQHPDPSEPLGFSGSAFAPRPGPAVDPTASPGVFDAPVITSYFDPADPDSPAPSVSSGDWLRNGRWYTEQSAVYMTRQANVKNDVRLAFDPINPLNPAEVSLDLALDPGYQPGLRSTIGRYLGRDIRNRDHSVEFTFLGLMHWQEFQSLTANSQLGLFQLIDPLADVPVYEGSDEQAFDQVSDFNSYELNYRIDRRLGRDRMVYTRDSCWVREATPSLLCSVFAGLRVAIVNERINWTASNELGNGSYRVITHNNMVGPQFGGDLMWEQTYWRAGVRATVGSLVNWASQSSTVRILDPNGDPLSPNRDEFAKLHTLSFVGGLNFLGEYRFRPNFGVRASYDLLWATDLALAQNQFTFFPSTPPEISASHSLFFQGVSLGVEWYR